MDRLDATNPAGFEVFDEATAHIPSRFRTSRTTRALIISMQLVCAVYSVFLLYWVWLAKDVAVQQILTDPIFYTYSLLVSGYVVTRFLLAPFYRPTPDIGYRPTASIVIPAFNEEEVVEATIDACFALDYPKDKLEVVIIDDGSSDKTWDKIKECCEKYPTLVAIQFSHNRGKRAAMAEGIRRSSGEFLVFIDSDSCVEPDGLAHLMADFADPRVGAVVGSADVLNKTKNWLTRMQQVRYYVAFRVVKGSESIFGAVTCASGCFSAYRTSAMMEVLDKWENQRFLGRPATYGDDRALTNYILRNHRVVYQANAKSHTHAPDKARQFLIQQLRWKKSWLRESLHVARFAWKLNPVAAALTYMGILFPWVAPIVIMHSLWFRAATGAGDPTFYLMGAYVMAVLYSLYYAIARKSPLWWHGITFVAIYMTILVWQTYWAVLRLRNTGWGTRASVHNEGEFQILTHVRHSASYEAQSNPTLI
jgi:hyaluronan synthase